MRNTIAALLLVLSWLMAFFAPAQCAARRYQVAWSHHPGWEVWGYIERAGLMQQWAERFGVEEIKIVLVNDYLESINLYTAGKVDACAMHVLDGLTIPALRGKDSTFVILGGFSSGNEGIVLSPGVSVNDLKGRRIRVAELSTAHYFLTRAFDLHNMKEDEVTLVNTRAEDSALLFREEARRGEAAAISTSSGALAEAQRAAGAMRVFDSSQLPGEIIDGLLVPTAANDGFKRAVAGAWFEALGIIVNREHPDQQDALALMASSAGISVAEFKARLKLVKLFYFGREAAAFAKSGTLKKSMEHIRSFGFTHGLYGTGVPDKDVLGIEFPDGTIVGNNNYVKLRFTANYMRMAADWLE